MTIAALIEQLKAYPHDWEIWADGGDYAASPGRLMTCAPGDWINAQAVPGV